MCIQQEPYLFSSVIQTEKKSIEKGESQSFLSLAHGIDLRVYVRAM